MNDAFKDFVDEVAGDYYSIGIESGHEALGNLATDILLGRLNDQLAEFGSAEQLGPKLFWQVTLKYAETKKTYTSVQKYYEGSPKLVHPTMMY